jgi:predicted nucleic acid-binding protein
LILVLDTAIAVAFGMPDEDDEIARRALDHLKAGLALVPSIFWHEVRNALIVSERRRRISRDDILATLARLRALPIHDAGAGDDHEIHRLATTHELTAYDAAYLALALDEKAALATTDKRLRRAAAGEGATLF